MKTKPDLGFWKLWNLSFGFFGVQIAYALQSANVSRIFATIGADPHDLSYFWILPPLMGLVVQPIVGTYSDRTWNRFGRRLPYLIVGALVAVAVMALLPNAGSFGLGLSAAIMFGLISLMFLDTSLNMAMQPFKMLVGDMVNEKQKGLAYSIQSFLCNAGSVVGYLLPFALAWFGMANTAPDGVVPPVVIYSFYIGAAVLLVCVLYSLVKIKEWPPQVYAEYNGTPQTSEKAEKKNVIRLLKEAPSTFWTVGLVQFFCWFAFLFMWTYTNGTVAKSAFNTPVIDKVTAITQTDATGKAIATVEAKGKIVLINDTVPVLEKGVRLVGGVIANGQYMEAATIVRNDNDTVTKDGKLFYGANGTPVAEYDKIVAKKGETIILDGTPVNLTVDATLVDKLSQLSGDVTFTVGQSLSRDHNTGKLSVLEGENVEITDFQKAEISTAKDLDTASAQYSEAGNWVGILFCIQSLCSVVWALVLPRFSSRKMSYAVSLIIGGIGFVLAGLISNKWALFLPFAMIGCGWAAMLAWPFTILTNSLKGGNIGAYLGLFNCSICIPQIVAAIAGGWILKMLSQPDALAPQYLMMIIAGIALFIGAACVYIIKEGKEEEPNEKEQVAKA